MEESDPKLMEKLTEAISSQLPSAYKARVQLAAIPPASLHRRYSFMYRYWIKYPDGMVKPILVKIPHESWMTTLNEATRSDHIRQIIQDEYKILSSIADAILQSGKPMLDAIRPRAILPEFNALLMDELSIKMLKSSLPKLFPMPVRKREWKNFERSMELCGEWLHVIHQKFFRDQYATLENLGLKKKAEADLKTIEQLQNQPLDELRDLFIQLYTTLEHVQIPLSCLHGDYHLGNIFMTEYGKIGALDPNWVEGGSIYLDLASLLVYPVTYKLQLLTQGLPFRNHSRERYESAILKGYQDGFQVLHPVLYLYCAVAVMEKWLDIEEVLKAGNSGFRRIGYSFITSWIRIYFRRLIKVYLLKGLRN